MYKLNINKAVINMYNKPRQIMRMFLADVMTLSIPFGLIDVFIPIIGFLIWFIFTTVTHRDLLFDIILKKNKDYSVFFIAHFLMYTEDMAATFGVISGFYRFYIRGGFNERKS